ncbi:alpha/beta fold hydrolase [Exiguobacterium sp. SH0S2]|uniref:alpha/beta fold hydrolase n=1 Tax=Exiguobacterium sp. SH0S2 TaxID=2510950 RepID=UPI00103BBE3D|nr:alpha/beta hydrolase [Exiguobacterium sp. SH0S2]TCI65217.1 alpha/beta hydrolase [Exiguobacterium sp. SH0S2]
MKRFVNVFGKELEVMTKGEHGFPIVILTGMGCAFDEWHEVSEKLSKANRVILYHRPGIGRSELNEGKRNTEATVRELRELLDVLQITEPFVLLGHSYGGLCAQHFAKRYPNDVAALILIDSTSHDLDRLDTLDLPVMNDLSSDEDWLKQCQDYAERTETELTELIQPTLAPNQSKLPVDVQAELKGFVCRPNLYKAMLAEVESWYDDARLIKRLGNLSTTPLYVIGRDADFEVDRGKADGLPESELRILEGTWGQLIREQTILSADSRLVIAEQASHAIHLDRPDVIISVVEECLSRLKPSRQFE